MNISQNLLQTIANYLVTKPYQEVAVMLNDLQREISIKPEQPIEEQKEESIKE